MVLNGSPSLAVPPTDAILCVNDETAFGVLHAARNPNLEIGKQLVMTSFDGVQDARHSELPLATMAAKEQT